MEPLTQYDMGSISCNCHSPNSWLPFSPPNWQFNIPDEKDSQLMRAQNKESGNVEINNLRMRPAACVQVGAADGSQARAQEVYKQPSGVQIPMHIVLRVFF